MDVVSEVLSSSLEVTEMTTDMTLDEFTSPISPLSLDADDIMLTTEDHDFLNSCVDAIKHCRKEGETSPDIIEIPTPRLKSVVEVVRPKTIVFNETQSPKSTILSSSVTNLERIVQNVPDFTEETELHEQSDLRTGLNANRRRKWSVSSCSNSTNSKDPKGRTAKQQKRCSSYFRPATTDVDSSCSATESLSSFSATASARSYTAAQTENHHKRLAAIKQRTAERDVRNHLFNKHHPQYKRSFIYALTTESNMWSLDIYNNQQQTYRLTHAFIPNIDINICPSYISAVFNSFESSEVYNRDILPSIPNMKRSAETTSLAAKTIISNLENKLQMANNLAQSLSTKLTSKEANYQIAFARMTEVEMQCSTVTKSMDSLTRSETSLKTRMDLMTRKLQTTMDNEKEQKNIIMGLNRKLKDMYATSRKDYQRTQEQKNMAALDHRNTDRIRRMRIAIANCPELGSRLAPIPGRLITDSIADPKEDSFENGTYLPLGMRPNIHGVPDGPGTILPEPTDASIPGFTAIFAGVYTRRAEPNEGKKSKRKVKIIPTPLVPSTSSSSSKK